MVETTINNRKGKKIITLIEERKNNKGLAFIMHGIGSNKDEPLLSTVSETFKQNNYTTLRFDTTNAWGNENGIFEESTLTNYYEDLEDVIKWSKNQPWYKEPFIIVGHSIGGLCMILFAEKYPEKVKAISLISTMISGKLTLETYPQELLERWEEKGMYEYGEGKKLKWNCVEDIKKYDALKNINNLKMPTLMIVGEKDPEAPIKHQKILYGRIPGKKDLKIIPGASHLFESQLTEIKTLFDNWINSN